MIRKRYLSKLLKSPLLLITALLVSTSNLAAQSLESRLEQLSAGAAKSYIKPAVEPFAANINSGWFNKAPKAKMLGLELEFGMVAMGSYFDEESDYFQTEGTFSFSEDEAATLARSVKNPNVRDQIIQQITANDFNVLISGPSITGTDWRNINVTFAPNGSEVLKVSDPNYPFPVYVRLPSQNIDLGVGGILGDYSILPSAAPQLKLGTVCGTRAVVRFLPGTELSEDIGQLDFFGFGLEHNLNFWFHNQLPMDVSLGFLSQKITVEDLLSINTTSYGLNLSKTLGSGWFSITPYSSFMLGKSTFEISYSQLIETDAGAQDVGINFEMEAENKSAINLGLYLHLGFINVFADYNFARYNSFTGGMFFGFGI